MPTHDDTPAAPGPEVLSAFDADAATLARTASGLINASWHATTAKGRRIVLQRVNPIFPAAVNDDIATVTAHLAARAVATPALVPTATGARWLDAGGSVWRALSYVDGASFDAIESTAQAAEAGRVLAEFHVGLADLEHAFASTRLGVHDTPRHLAGLRAALAEHAGHPEIEPVSRLADDVFALAASLAALPAVPDRVVHGDPKISNILFDSATGRGLCMIDLDTVGCMPVPLELGDAFRSWCNPRAEDAADSGFSLQLFAAGVGGYARAAAGWLTEPEWRAIPDATLAIAVELAARFCADALRERYFAFDAARYASRGLHNQARTRGQLAVARQIRVALEPMREIVERAFTAAPP